MHDPISTSHPIAALPSSRANALDHWTAEDLEGSCPVCDAFAVVELPARLKARQPDGTTHVCHPAFDGCNRGFAVD